MPINYCLFWLPAMHFFLKEVSLQLDEKLRCMQLACALASRTQAACGDLLFLGRSSPRLAKCFHECTAYLRRSFTNKCAAPHALFFCLSTQNLSDDVKAMFLQVFGSVAETPFKELATMCVSLTMPNHSEVAENEDVARQTSTSSYYES